MNGNTHFWIVCDAVRFVRENGTEREKKAFQAWESAYGGKNLNDTPYYESRIEDIVGRESIYTDHYHDLAMEGSKLWHNEENVTEYDGYVFTALNHFMAVPWEATRWRRTNGYYYPWSSKTSDDYKAMENEDLNKINGHADLDSSPIIFRCQFDSTLDSWSYLLNWQSGAKQTCFIPVSTLGYFYYWRFVFKYFDHLDVNGEVWEKINGLHLLGPVVHAIADACVPQHVISAMGYFHQIWENWMDTEVWNWNIDLDRDLVRYLLRNHMKNYRYTDGEMKGKFAVDYVIAKLCGWHTYVKFLEYNGLDNIDQMHNDNFWFAYMMASCVPIPTEEPSKFTTKFRREGNFFYNLAIAGTIRLITESYYDVLDPFNPDNKVNGVTSYQPVSDIPTRKPDGYSGDRVELGVEGDYRTQITASMLLGFTPNPISHTEDILYHVRCTLYYWDWNNPDNSRIEQALKELENEFFQQFNYAYHAGLKGREAPKVLKLPEYVNNLRKDCGLPEIGADIKTDSTWGIGTFRVPTVEETSSPEKLKAYLKEYDKNRINSELLRLTRCIAFHRFLIEIETPRNKVNEIRESVKRVEKLRSFIIANRYIPVIAHEPGLESTKLDIKAEHMAHDVEIVED